MFLKLAGIVGFEPTTYGLTVRCTNHCATFPKTQVRKRDALRFPNSLHLPSSNYYVAPSHLRKTDFINYRTAQYIDYCFRHNNQTDGYCTLHQKERVCLLVLQLRWESNPNLRFSTKLQTFNYNLINVRFGELLLKKTFVLSIELQSHVDKISQKTYLFYSDIKQNLILHWYCNATLPKMVFVFFFTVPTSSYGLLIVTLETNFLPFHGLRKATELHSQLHMRPYDVFCDGMYGFY